jgi:hypothetical protein
MHPTFSTGGAADQKNQYQQAGISEHGDNNYGNSTADSAINGK